MVNMNGLVPRVVCKIKNLVGLLLGNGIFNRDAKPRRPPYPLEAKRDARISLLHLVIDVLESRDDVALVLEQPMREPRRFNGICFLQFAYQLFPYTFHALFAMDAWIIFDFHDRRSHPIECLP